VTERESFYALRPRLNALWRYCQRKYKASSKVKNISKEGALVLLEKPLRKAKNRPFDDVPGTIIPILLRVK